MNDTGPTTEAKNTLFFAETVGSGQHKTKFCKKGIPANVRLHCAWCGVAAGKLVKCSGCKIARYCGARCQKFHWKGSVHCHKHRCRDVFDRELLFSTGNPQEDKIHCMWIKSQAEANVVKAIRARLAQQAEAEQ
jgi:hypothetical protein